MLPFPPLYIWDSLIVCCHYHVWCQDFELFKEDRSLQFMIFIFVISFYWCYRTYIPFAQILMLLVLLTLNVLLSLPFLVDYYLNQWWDIGKGFRIPEVYRTGYTVIALSVITSIAVALLWADNNKRWAGRKEEERVEGNVDWIHCGSFVYMFCSGLLKAPFHQSIK